MFTTVNSLDPDDSLSIELCLDEAHTRDAIDVMHRAFAEYTAKGETSGAMLETAESLAQEIAAGERVAVVRRAGEAVAVAKHHPTANGSLYFGRLGVIPEERGRGVARLLVQRLREAARHEGLSGLACTVRAEEKANIALYERLGMTIVSRGVRTSRTGAVLQVVDMADDAL